MRTALYLLSLALAVSPLHAQSDESPPPLKNTALEVSSSTPPDSPKLSTKAPCATCDEDDANATRGYPIKGRVTKIMAKRGMALVKHEEIPGVMRAMTMAFKVEPNVLPNLKVGQRLLGRIERRDRQWHLFSVRLLGKVHRSSDK